MSPRNRDASPALAQAHRDAIAFSLAKVSSLLVSPEQASQYAEQEAAFPVITIDKDGVTSGMRAAVLQPVRRMQADWRQVHEAFTTALQPHMNDIQAVADLQAEAEAEVTQRDDELEAVERELRQAPRYEDIDRHKLWAETRYKDFVNRHANRAAIMDNIVGFAAGTTVVLAILLALAAHGHGEILKQWSFRFGPERSPAKRWSDWRLFGLSSSGLLIVLIFAGAARYIAGLENLGSADQASALGDLGVVQVNPFRDVMVSMLANLGAWMVGVIVSYLSHGYRP